MADVKFKLRMVKFLEPFTSLTSNPTGIRKNISTVYTDLSTVSDIISKIKEFFSNETCDKFTKSGDSLTYSEETGIEVDEEDLTERLTGYFDNMVKYGRTVWTCHFDSQGATELNWDDNVMYEAQLLITETKLEEPEVIIYPGME